MTDPLDVMIAFEQMKADNKEGKDYPGRDLLPEIILAHADNYYKLTGQEPDNRARSDWIQEMSYWNTKGLEPDDITTAFNSVNFPVIRPGSLTNTAVALKARRRARTVSPEIFRAADQPEIKSVPMSDETSDKMRRILAEAKKRDSKFRADRVGRSAHEPTPISEVMKGMKK